MTGWSPGQTIRETRLFRLPDDLPPADYRLVIGVYHPVTLERLPLMTPPAPDGVWPLAEWRIK